jgi:hypothetical protein
MADDRYIDQIAPSSTGEDRINLALHEDTPAAREGAPVLVVPDFDDCLPEGASLPLRYTVADPDGTLIEERTFQRFRPAVLEFTPTRGGPHLVRLAELFHNRWFGALVVNVDGDERTV